MQAQQGALSAEALAFCSQMSGLSLFPTARAATHAGQ